MLPNFSYDFSKRLNTDGQLETSVSTKIAFLYRILLLVQLSGRVKTYCFSSEMYSSPAVLLTSAITTFAPAAV